MNRGITVAPATPPITMPPSSSATSTPTTASPSTLATSALTTTAYPRISEVLDQRGHLDILVNNAGISVDKTVRRMTAQEWDHVIHVNLSGAFYPSRAILQHMLERGYGRIINISWVIGSARRVRSGELRRRQVRHVRADHGPGPGDRQQAHHHQHGHVRVRHHRHDRGHPPAAAMDKIAARIPVGRLGEPGEVARVVEFLADPESAYITTRSARSTAACTCRRVLARAEG